RPPSPGAVRGRVVLDLADELHAVGPLAPDAEPDLDGLHLFVAELVPDRLLEGLGKDGIEAPDRVLAELDRLPEQLPQRALEEPRVALGLVEELAIARAIDAMHDLPIDVLG